MDFGYSFNLYLRGPYSPSLADDYYRLDIIKEEEKRVVYDTGNLKKFENFKNFIKTKAPEDLELIATIHYIWESNKHLLNKPTLSRFKEEELIKMIVKKVVDLKGANEVKVRKNLEEIKKISAQKHF